MPYTFGLSRFLYGLCISIMSAIAIVYAHRLLLFV